MWKGSVPDRSRVVAALASLARRPPAHSRRPIPRSSRRRARIHNRVIALDTHVDIDPRNFTDRASELHRQPEHAGQSAEDVRGRSGRGVLQHLRRPGPAHGRGLSARVRRGHGEVRGGAPARRSSSRRTRSRSRIAPTTSRRSPPRGRRSRSWASRTRTASERISGTSRSSTIRARATCRWRTTATARFSDSNTGERDDVWLYHGLSPLGKQAVAELNRVGIMIDISHPSKESMMQTLALRRRRSLRRTRPFARCAT